MPGNVRILPEPAWAQPFGEWYRHWGVAVVLGLATIGAFALVFRDSLPVILIAIVMVPGTILNAWLGYQGRALVNGDISVLEGRIVDGRLELGGLSSPLARRRWASFEAGTLSLEEVGSTKQGAVLYALTDGESEVRFLHDSDVSVGRLSAISEMSRRGGLHIVLTD